MVPCSAPTVCDRSVVLILDDRPDPQLWGHCKSTHNSHMICLYDLHIINLWFTLYLCSFSSVSVHIRCIFHSFNGFSVVGDPGTQILRSATCLAILFICVFSISLAIGLTRLTGLLCRKYCEKQLWLFLEGYSHFCNENISENSLLFVLSGQ